MKWLIVLLSVSLLVTPALAYDPGIITPEHGFLYQLDRLFDNLKILLSPDKTSALIDVMNERLAELNISGGDTLVLMDYQEKLRELEKELNMVDNTTKQSVAMVIENHRKVLEDLESRVPEHLKPMVERAINETRTVIKDDHSSETESVIQHHEEAQLSGSEIVVPSSIRVGQPVEVRVRICNPFNVPVTPVVKVEVKKEGLMGLIFKKEYMRVFPTAIPAGSCYEDVESVVVPESAMGIPTSGTWKFSVEVTANGQDLLEKEFTVSVEG